MQKVWKDVPKSDLLRLKPVLKLYFKETAGVKVFLNTLGFINRTYLVELGGRKFILRQSNPSVSLKDLRFEVETLNFLKRKHFHLTPRITSNLAKEEIVKSAGNLYVLQNFLPGAVKASWRNLKKYTLPLLKEHFKVSAEFTRAVENFCPNVRFRKPTLSDYLSSWRKSYQSALRKIPSSAGKIFLRSSEPKLFFVLSEARSAGRQLGFKNLPKQLVHYDLHPGNFHFQGGKVVGLFDFDWARMDTRLADMAATISQSCYYYGGGKHGIYRKDRIKAGLRAYRAAYGRSEFSKSQEKSLLKVALTAYNFFQLLVVMDWYSRNNHERDAMVYLSLFVNLLTKNDYNEILI